MAQSFIAAGFSRDNFNFGCMLWAHIIKSPLHYYAEIEQTHNDWDDSISAYKSIYIFKSITMEKSYYCTGYSKQIVRFRLLALLNEFTKNSNRNLESNFMKYLYSKYVQLLSTFQFTAIVCIPHLSWPYSSSAAQTFFFLPYWYIGRVNFILV